MTRPQRKRAVRLRLVAALLTAVSTTIVCPTLHAADINRGAELYRMHCTSCHGGDGRPLMPGATDFTRPSALLKPDLSLLSVIRAGRGGMPAYQGQLRDREMLDIVAHLRTQR